MRENVKNKKRVQKEKEEENYLKKKNKLKMNNWIESKWNEWKMSFN